MTRRFIRFALTAALAIPIGMCTAQTTAPLASQPSDTRTTEPAPVDWRHRLAAESFVSSGTGVWIAPRVDAAFPFDELIYSWNIRLPEKQAFRLHVMLAFPDGRESPWLYAGYWGAVTDLTTETKRGKLVFDRGELDMDWVRLKEKASAYRFKVVDAGAAPLKVLPSINVVTTDNHPSPELAARFAAKSPTGFPARLLDIPMRRQIESNGTLTPNRCQSAALASAMQYFGTSVPLELISAKTYDPEYAYPGIWPRVIGTANDFGFDGYIERFRDWASVRKALAENKAILCSIRLKEGECKSPPYAEMGNHIVVLNGLTDDGRVVVTDSFLGKSGWGYRCQWLAEDFGKIWMGTKNGVSLVICPPAGARPHTITDLPPFPADRVPITGDDH